MARGRKKESNQQKVLRGTAQPCRMLAEVGADDGQRIGGANLSAIPKVKLKGAAKKIFAYTATQLLNNGLLEVVGVDLLAAYSREMAIYQDMMVEVEAEGFTLKVETKNGTATIVNPKRKVAESALTNAKSIASDFGFTPISRSRISGLAAPKATQDDFAEFEELK